MRGSNHIRIIESLIYPTLFVLLLWIIKLVEIKNQVSFAHLGILPRKLIGLPGIAIAPLIHGDFYHLFSNSIPLLILGITIVYFYRNIAFHVFFVVYLFSNFIVWTIASAKGYHLGSSGLVYGFVSFLFFSGIFRSDKKSMILSIAVVIVYGSLIWGILPIYEGVSWESHFFGTFTGGLCSYIYRKKKEIVPVAVKSLPPSSTPPSSQPPPEDTIM